MEYEISHTPELGDHQWQVTRVIDADCCERIALFGRREDAAEYVTLKGGTIVD